jgi:hypothetical protein
VFALDAWNDVVARDRVKMNSGGAIALPSATSRVMADVNNATVRVENGAEVTSVGDINMGTRSTADVYSQVAVDTYGVAGAPQGESLARFQSLNLIDIGDAKVEALNDVNLGAGRTTVNNGSLTNNLSATARTDLFNNTLIPIDTDPTPTPSSTIRTRSTSGRARTSARCATPPSTRRRAPPVLPGSVSEGYLPRDARQDSKRHQ